MAILNLTYDNEIPDYNTLFNNYSYAHAGMHRGWR